MTTTERLLARVNRAADAYERARIAWIDGREAVTPGRLADLRAVYERAAERLANYLSTGAN